MTVASSLHDLNALGMTASAELEMLLEAQQKRFQSSADLEDHLAYMQLFLGGQQHSPMPSQNSPSNFQERCHIQPAHSVTKA
jgi:hypothetical protein